MSYITYTKPMPTAIQSFYNSLTLHEQYFFCTMVAVTDGDMDLIEQYAPFYFKDYPELTEEEIAQGNAFLDENIELLPQDKQDTYQQEGQNFDLKGKMVLAFLMFANTENEMKEQARFLFEHDLKVLCI